MFKTEYETTPSTNDPSLLRRIPDFTPASIGPSSASTPTRNVPAGRRESMLRRGVCILARTGLGHAQSSAGYAGKKQEVKVRHDEGLAIHIDPESCAVTREGLGEALTGERIGQPSSRGRGIISGADAVLFAEGKTEGRVNRECPEGPAWSETLACA